MPKCVCACGRVMVRSANETCWRCWKKAAKNVVIRDFAIQLDLFEQR